MTIKKRTKTLPAIITGVAILIGGIWMINESRYPNVPAFDDHFTRKFLNKDKKVGDGFYEFKSKTGQYTMWFPEGYRLLSENGDYARDNKDFEQWGAVPSSENKVYLFKRRFGLSIPNKIENSQTRVYYQSAYIYFKGTEKRVIVDKKKHIPNAYLAYVADKSSNKVLQISFDSSDKYKSGDEDKKKEWFLKILENIHFKDEK
ncbi:hypothetical protein RKD56_001563 [Priestia megaterium]|jgi:hypothetical protein